MRRPSVDPLRVAVGAAACVQALDLVENAPRPASLALAIGVLALPCLPLWRSAAAWGAVALVDLTLVLAKPLAVPNHHFLVTYTALALALAFARAEDAPRVVARNARLLLAGVLGFATVQKLLSPLYPESLGYTIATGGFAAPVVVHLDALASALGSNSARAEVFLATPPLAGTTLALQVPTTFHAWSLATAAAIVALEGVLAGLALLRPRPGAFHLGLCTFLATLLLLREERLFTSVLAALGLLMLADRRSRWAWAYRALLLVSLPLAVARLAGH